MLPEGVLFRTNEEAFTKTKKKLLEECDLWCIVSLPGGVFSAARAGMKTNLLFFTRGKPTESIWYYDLTDRKVGKKTPLTVADFAEFFELLPKREESERSWNLDFTARRKMAAEDAKPFREAEAALKAQAREKADSVAKLKRAKRPLLWVSLNALDVGTDATGSAVAGSRSTLEVKGVSTHPLPCCPSYGHPTRRPPQANQFSVRDALDVE